MENFSSPSPGIPNPFNTFVGIWRTGLSGSLHYFHSTDLPTTTVARIRISLEQIVDEVRLAFCYVRAGRRNLSGESSRFAKTFFQNPLQIVLRSISSENKRDKRLSKNKNKNKIILH